MEDFRPWYSKAWEPVGSAMRRAWALLAVLLLFVLALFAVAVAMMITTAPVGLVVYFVMPSYALTAWVVSAVVMFFGSVLARLVS